MKRKISIFLALILCFCVWAEPVKAAELENGSLINVLDFATANESGINRVFASSSSSVATAAYRLPNVISIRYVEMVINSVAGDLLSCSVNGTVLTVETLQYRLFRVYGTLSTVAASLNISFNGSANGNGFYILGLNVSTYSSLSYDIEGYCSITANGWEGTDIHYVPTDDVNHRTFTGATDPWSAGLSLFLWTEDWKKYDYIDFQLYLTIQSISSITAVMGNTAVPIDISYVNPPSYIANDFYVTIRLYTSGLDRTVDDYPMIILEGLVISDHINLISVMNISGHVLTDNVDPVAYWLYSLNKNLNSYILDQTNQLVSEFSSLQSINDAGFKNITSAIASLSSTVLTGFSNVDTWISQQTTGISSVIQAFRVVFADKMDSLELHLTSLFTSLHSWIQTQTDVLVAAILGDAHAGDDFQQDVDDKNQELEDMAAVMDSVTRPALDQIDVSVDSYVTQADITTLTSPLLVFFTGDIFGPIVIMTILMATVSYVLYGKR